MRRDGKPMVTITRLFEKCIIGLAKKKKTIHTNWIRDKIVSIYFMGFVEGMTASL